MAAPHPFASMPPSDGGDALLESAATREAERAEPPDAERQPPQPAEDPLSPAPAEEREVDARAQGDEDPWRLAQSLMEADEIMEAVVVGHNRGGLLVHWCGLQGFVPASQLVGLSSLHVEEARMTQLETRQGACLQLKIIEVQPDMNRLIFSERATEVTASAREDLLETLAPGQVRVGQVTNLADFGAFVDLGGVEGLLHISELSWRRLTHPGDVVRPGQKLNVLILSVDADRGRVALSRKKLRQDPWLGVEERYQPEQQVRGKVSSVADFGVFVLLEEGLEGLLHNSELEGVADESDALSPGATIEAQVLYVSERKRRLALTLGDGGAPCNASQL